MPGSEHVFFCGETAKGQRLGANTYALRLDGLDPEVMLRIEDVSGPMVADIPDVLLDLLEVAAFVYAADAHVVRGGAKDAEWGKRWRRKFKLTVPVRDLKLWQRSDVLTPLTETLSILSDDFYEFQFVGLTNQPKRQAYFKFDEAATERPRIDRVQLFSGGLDSFAGAAEILARSNDSLALISHRSANQIAKAQLLLIQALQAKFGKARVFHVPVWTQLTQRSNKESTHRARSFLFAALAAVVARLFGKDDCAFYENGVTSLNLPISRQVVGARATRSTHPVALKGFGQVFSALFNQSFSVRNPFADRTKTEIVEAVVQSGMQDNIRDTRSCANVRSATIQYPHCGICSQCVDRRLAVVAAQAEVHDPQEAYKTPLFTGARPVGPQRALALGMVEIARTMHREDDTGLFHTFPEISRVIRADEGAEDLAALRILGLLKRHGQSVVTAVARGLEVHRHEFAEGTLPRDCLLALLGAADTDRAEKPVISQDEMRLPIAAAIEICVLPSARPQVQVSNDVVKGQNAEVLTLLANIFWEDQTQGRALENFRFMTASEIADGLGWTSEDSVRQVVKRCRSRLRKLNESQAFIDDNMIIENLPRRGYRLNPSVVHLISISAE